MTLGNPKKEQKNVFNENVQHNNKSSKQNNDKIWWYEMKLSIMTHWRRSNDFNDFILARLQNGKCYCTVQTVRILFIAFGYRE